MHFTQYVFYLYSILLVYIYLSVRPSVSLSFRPSIRLYFFLQVFFFVCCVCVFFRILSFKKEDNLVLCVFVSDNLWAKLKIVQLISRRKKVLNKTLLFLLLLTTSCSFNIMLLINAAVFSVLFFSLLLKAKHYVYHNIWLYLAVNI